MGEHTLHLRCSSSAKVPARICVLLAQRSVALTSIHMMQPGDGLHWLIQLRVRAKSASQVELLTRQLSRLVDVVTVQVQDEEGGK